MANNNSPFGMRPVLEGNGSPWSGTCTTYFVQASDPTALYIGDPVILDGGSDANGIPSVVRATAGSGNRVTGSVVGFGVNPALVANGAVRLASTAAYVKVADGVGVTYAIQTNGTTAAGDTGQNANLAAGTGNTIQGSQFVLDQTSLGTGATKQLRILSAQQGPGNEIGQYCTLMVRINLPTEAGNASGTGV